MITTTSFTPPALSPRVFRSPSLAVTRSDLGLQFAPKSREQLRWSDFDSKSRGKQTSPMESEGHRGASSNPTAMLAALVRKREKLQDELRHIEKQVYDLETSYLQDSTQCGNVLKGFEGFLSSSKNTANLKRPRKFQPEDRLFSLSSVTSPAVDEQLVDGRGDYGPGKSKGASTPANGQGKPKKGGRIAPREAKRIRPLADVDMDDEDEQELSLR